MEPPPVEPDEPLEEDELPGADPESMVRDFGSHPMMHRIQDALYKQLQLWSSWLEGWPPMPCRWGMPCWRATPVMPSPAGMP